MDTQLYHLHTEPQDAGKRLDSYLASQLSDLTRSAVQRLCEHGLVRVDGVCVSKSYILRGGQTVEVSVPPPRSMDAVAQNIPVPIIYEDGDLVVVDKPKGMVVHPAPGNEDGTLVNALLYHCGDSLSSIGGVARPGIVHRIDKDTSGLLVVAKNDMAHVRLAQQIKEHTVTRKYRAIVYGNVKQDSSRIAAPIGRHPTERKHMCVTEKNSREAATNFLVLERLDGFTYLELALETGRTHQIRVHMAYIGHPVAGDAMYGPKKVITGLGGQCLHACTLGFQHPATGEYMEFNSEIPEYFRLFLSKHRQGDS